MRDRDFINTALLAGGVAIVSAVVTTLILVSLYGGFPGAVLRSALNRTGNEAVQDFAPSTDSESLVVGAVKQANPAVVAITISKNVPVYERYMQEVPDSFGDLFGGGDYLNVPGVRQKGTEKREIGGGSGFFVAPDGYIVTNKHVVSDTGADYTVQTNDGKKYPAKVVARDPVLDLAVIKIDGTNFPHLSFSDSDKLELGRSVIVIGNALAEFHNTVSVGVVSGLSRSIVANDDFGGSESLDELIQTDAAINPGNSGGPLLNLHGDVVGIAVATAGDAENVSFAIPGNSVKQIVDSVKATGRIVRPFLGVRYEPITNELKTKNHLTIDHGVLVARGDTKTDLAVVPGSPADKAGIVENDIIVSIDGTPLNEDHSLASIIRRCTVGQTVKLHVLHRGKEEDVSATLEEMK